MQMADSTGVDLESAVIMDLEHELSERIRMYAERSSEDELLSKIQDGMDSDGNNEHRDHLNLDSDLDSDALEDEIDKSKGDNVLNDSVESLNEELALAEPPAKSEPKPRRLLFKRKTIPDDDKTAEGKPPTKKVILHQQKPNPQALSLQPTRDKVEEKPTKPTPKTRVEPQKDKIEEKPTKTKPKTRVQPPNDKVEEKLTKTTPETRVEPPKDGVEEKPTKTTPKTRVEPPKDKVEENSTKTTPKNNRVEPAVDEVEKKSTKTTVKTNRVKITAPVDSAPTYRPNRDEILQMNEAQKKQDRLNRFGPATAFGTSGMTAVPHSRDNMENLKKRAASFDKSSSR